MSSPPPSALDQRVLGVGPTSAINSCYEYSHTTGPKETNDLMPDPQFGQPGGGAPPETDLYTAALAPEDSVPVAIFPPFSEQMTQPTKCVIFSELTDFEKDQKMIPRPQPFRVRLFINI